MKTKNGLLFGVTLSMSMYQQDLAMLNWRGTYIIYPLDPRLELCQSKVNLDRKHDRPILLSIPTDFWRGTPT